MTARLVIQDVPRRFHASSTAAFRKHCDYACAIERHQRMHPADRIVLWGCTVAAACFAAIVVLRWLPGAAA